MVRSMVRGVIKTGICHLLHHTGTNRLLHALTDIRKIPLVVGYHRVVDRAPAQAGDAIPAMLISQRTFERHLDWIGRRFHFVSIDELVVALENGRNGSRPIAAVTFDDGYSDVYHHAFPILKRKGIPAAVFVVTQALGASRPMIHDRLYRLLLCAVSRNGSTLNPLMRVMRELKSAPACLQELRAARTDPFALTRALLVALPQHRICAVMDALEKKVQLSEGELNGICPMSWEMLAEMQRAGIVIGSHSRTHVLLTNENLQRVKDEIDGSRRDLEARLQSPVLHFAYPDGRFNAETVRVVASSGYRYAYTTCPHRDRNHPLLTIPRRVLWENSCLDAKARFSPAVMSCHVAGVFDWFNGCPQNHLTPSRVGPGEGRESEKIL